MNSLGRISLLSRSIGRSGASALDKTPVLGSLLVGFVGSLCCGGSLIFGAIGLGAFYGALGISRYIPEALASGAVLVTLLNWLYYRRKAARMLATSTQCDCASLRRAAMWSGFLGLAMLAASFLFLEWLNHGVVHASHFMHHPDYAGAVIPGVPNQHLAYVAMTFLALLVLAFLPLPGKVEAAAAGRRVLAS